MNRERLPTAPEADDAEDELFEEGALFDVKSSADVATNEELLLLGTSMFVLLSSWSSWVERRVEQVEFVTLNSVRRDISVDLYVPHELAPLRWPAFEPEHRKFALPIALYTKRRLNQFSLRDAKDGALPLLARRHNIPLAAATLVAAARAWTDVPESTPIPTPVLEDLWSIASLPRPRALGVWRALGRPLNPDDKDECTWRRAMIMSPEFMAIAIDFARNFIVAAIISAKHGERRLIKFSYVEESRPAWLGEEPVQPRQIDDVAGAEETPDPGANHHVAEPEEAPDPGGKGRVYITASIVPQDDEDTAAPAANVRYIVAGPAGRHFARTDERGLAVVQADVGDYHVVEEELPPRLLPVTATQTVSVTAGSDEAHLSFEYKRGGPEPQGLPSLGVREWAARAAGLTPKEIVIEAPSVGHAHSYHLEFEVPTGMRVTTGRLLDASAYNASGIKPGHVLDPGTPTLQQRVHVYASGVGQERTGAGEFLLRPRDATVLKPAVVVGWFSLMLLLLLVIMSALSIWDSGAMSNRSPATLATLLLLVPGGLSAYISRGSEHQFAARALFGIRLLALATGFWAFAAATTIAVSDLTATHGFANELVWREPAFIVLVCILIGQAMTLWPLRVAHRRSVNPPEKSNPRGGSQAAQRRADYHA